MKILLSDGQIHDFDKELYKVRNIIERFFNRIKNFRHVATRYDKLSIYFLNFVILAAVITPTIKDTKIKQKKETVFTASGKRDKVRGKRRENL